MKYSKITLQSLTDRKHVCICIISLFVVLNMDPDINQMEILCDDSDCFMSFTSI